eukprot:7387542-Prymnesium_polylepis.1
MVGKCVSDARVRLWGSMRYNEKRNVAREPNMKELRFFSSPTRGAAQTSKREVKKRQKVGSALASHGRGTRSSPRQVHPHYGPGQSHRHSHPYTLDPHRAPPSQILESSPMRTPMSSHVPKARASPDAA